MQNDTIRQSISLPAETGQGNPIRGKVSQEQAKLSEIHPFPVSYHTKNTKLTAIAYTEELIKTHEAPCLSFLSL